MDPIARMYEARDLEGIEDARKYTNPPQRFRASELADCKRAVFYRLSGYVPAPDTGWSSDFSVDGDVHHDIVRQVMLRYGVKLAGITQNEDGSTEEDAYVVHDFVHEGRTLTVSTRQDGWIYHEDYGWMLLEIKSVGHWKYSAMEKAAQAGGHDKLLEYLHDKYKNYIFQVHAGMAIARARGVDALPFDPSDKHTLDHAFLVIKNRSECHVGFKIEDTILGGVVVPFDEETWQAALRRLYVIKGKVNDGTPPLAEYPAGHRNCGYCRYRYLCHDADKRRNAGLSPAAVYPDPRVGIQMED